MSTKNLFLTPAMLADLRSVNAGLHAQLDTHDREQLAHGVYFLTVSDDLALRVTLVTHRNVCTAHEGT
jgi:hypothetical protein